MMVGMNHKSKLVISAEQAALESMTPQELDLEYTRITGEPPPETATREALIKRVLAKLPHKI